VLGRCCDELLLRSFDLLFFNLEFCGQWRPKDSAFYNAANGILLFDSSAIVWPKNGSVALVSMDRKYRFELSPSQPQIIGRSRGCDLLVDELTVARKHAKLAFDASGWSVEDLNSPSGMFVNDEFVRQKQRIVPGDRLTIGEVVLLFSASDAPNKT
jgi:hypothetical protein